MSTSHVLAGVSSRRQAPHHERRVAWVVNRETESEAAVRILPESASLRWAAMPERIRYVDMCITP